jgi:hypothetical protein
VAVGKKKHRLLLLPILYISTKFGKKRSVVSKVGNVATIKDFKERK